MLYFIGLGLGDAKDITVKGLEIEEFYGREVIVAERDLVEQGSDEILADAKTQNVCFLVVGDPFGATTHTDLVLRAQEKQIPYKVIHNASIINAVGCCGLQLYNFGEAVSFVMWTDTWKPRSYFDKVLANRKHGLHTLCLLDIKMREQSVENMMRGRKVYEPPRFMSTSEACSQILQILEDSEPSTGEEWEITPSTTVIGLARVGSDTQKIVAASVIELSNLDLGPPLHSLVIPAPKLHPIESDMLRIFSTSVNADNSN